MTWCLIYGYEIEVLELNGDEIMDLLSEKSTKNLPSISTSTVGVYKLFGVEITYAEFPRRSAIRTRYLQLINSPTWIEWLAQDMEQYA